MLHVRRATTPEANSMHATEKSGDTTSSDSPTSLLGMRHEAKEVTLTAGPKKAISHVT